MCYGIFGRASQYSGVGAPLRDITLNDLYVILGEQQLQDLSLGFSQNSISLADLNPADKTALLRHLKGFSKCEILFSKQKMVIEEDKSWAIRILGAWVAVAMICSLAKPSAATTAILCAALSVVMAIAIRVSWQQHNDKAYILHSAIEVIESSQSQEESSLVSNTPV